MAFLRVGFGLAERGAAWSIATHDGRIREALLLAHGPLTVEQLFGVRPEILNELHTRGIMTVVKAGATCSSGSYCPCRPASSLLPGLVPWM